MWNQLRLDDFWRPRLAPLREGRYLLRTNLVEKVFLAQVHWTPGKKFLDLLDNNCFWFFRFYPCQDQQQVKECLRMFLGKRPLALNNLVVRGDRRRMSATRLRGAGKGQRRAGDPLVHLFPLPQAPRTISCGVLCGSFENFIQ